MSFNSDDDKKSDNTEINLQGTGPQIINSNKNSIINNSHINQKNSPEDSRLNFENSSFEDKNDDNIFLNSLQPFSKKENIINSESDSSQKNGANYQVHKPTNDSNQKQNPRILQISNAEVVSKTNSKNIKNTEQKDDDLRNSKNVIKTVDSERPPSGYSSYSYYYDYSDSENEQNNYRHQDNKKGRKKKKNKKVCPTYNPPVINVPQDELSILKKKAMKLEPLEDLNDDVYESLILSLAEDRKKCAKSEDLAQSECLNKAINHVTECQLEQRKYVLQQETYSKYKDQMILIQKELQEFDEETAREEAKLRSQISFQRCSLQEQHERQIQMLQQQWNSDAKMKQYNHASPRLLFLRKQYQQLIQQCRFKEATEVKAQIAQIERKEENDAIKVMQHNFDESINQILKKQNEELQFFDARSKIQIKKYRQERKSERIPIEHKESKLKNMEGRINDPDRLWNRCQMKRTVEISQGKIRDAKVSAKLTAKDLGQKEETTIKLPKLKLRRKVAKPTI